MLCHRILSLPMHPYLTEAEAARVVEAVAGAT
jgi:dTDP-4-amino-4,6-dideoxygalactose transaminase